MVHRPQHHCCQVFLRTLALRSIIQDTGDFTEGGGGGKAVRDIEEDGFSNHQHHCCPLLHIAGALCPLLQEVGEAC